MERFPTYFEHHMLEVLGIVRKVFLIRRTHDRLIFPMQEYSFLLFDGKAGKDRISPISLSLWPYLMYFWGVVRKKRREQCTKAFDCLEVFRLIEHTIIDFL
jgi:hypothetical protein